MSKPSPIPELQVVSDRQLVGLLAAGVLLGLAIAVLVAPQLPHFFN